METINNLIKNEIEKKSLSFIKRPILFGGLAMEYYGIKKSGNDIDLIVCDEDYEKYAKQYPNEKFDIWGDRGVFFKPIEIYRSNVHLDYNFYLDGAIENENVNIISIEKLTLTRIFAMDERRYMEELKLIDNYYRNKYSNKKYLEETEKNQFSYDNIKGGLILGGKYLQ